MLKSELFNIRSGPVFTSTEHEKFGEYATLYKSIRERGYDVFHGYTRMSNTTFDYIVNKIQHRISTCNSNICPEEKLLLTLR